MICFLGSWLILICVLTFCLSVNRLGWKHLCVKFELSAELRCLFIENASCDSKRSSEKVIRRVWKCFICLKCCAFFKFKVELHYGRYLELVSTYLLVILTICRCVRNTTTHKFVGCRRLRRSAIWKICMEHNGIILGAYIESLKCIIIVDVHLKKKISYTF